MKKAIWLVLLAFATLVQAQTKVVKGQISDYYISTEKTYSISGVCTDNSGKPLKDVMVMVKYGVSANQTDENGQYKITIGKDDKALVFYYPGKVYTEKAIDLNHPVINCQLTDDTKDYTLIQHTRTKTPWFDPDNDRPTTYCNPVNIDYNFEYFNHSDNKGVSCRSTADPIIVPYKGEYYIFSTNQSGYYVSADLTKWKYIPANFQRKPNDDDQCAPTVEVFGDTMIMLGSTYRELPVWYTTDPKSGRWKHLAETAILPHWDPSLFNDDDGRMYLYYGSSNTFPLKAVEYDKKTFRPKSIIHEILKLHPEKHGWERFGMNNDDSVTLAPFTEGAFVTKHQGKYFLQYGAPGTEFKVYADGVYVSDNPLGPFTYQHHNPMSYKPGGFVLGAGHGGTFKDNYGNYWHIATCMLSLREKFERRIGLYPAGFDKDNVMYMNSSFGDYPCYVADGQEDHIKGNHAGWMLLSMDKKMTASSVDSIHEPSLAADENMRTYWTATSGNAGEWLQMDLGSEKSVRAIQVNFYEHKANQKGKAFDIYHQYKIYRSMDGTNWELAVDKSDNDQDVPHDYIELKSPMEARYLKIENVHMAAKGHFAIMDFRVFGQAKGNKPAAVKNFKVNRSTWDSRNAIISWDKQTDAYAYNIYFGKSADKLYNCITVNRDNFYDFRGMDKDDIYYFNIESLSETGISSRSKTIIVK